MRRNLHALCCLLTLAPAIGAARSHASSQAPAAKTIEIETLGPKVGERMPDFSLRDQHGQTQSLKSLLGPDGAVIVFFRSADW